VHCRNGGWAAGADTVQPAPWAGRAVVLPAGRLHAVEDDGVLTGRARCGAPVALLDPSVFGWPDAATSQWPLCWSCLALTR
jgi:hypothetical protein